MDKVDFKNITHLTLGWFFNESLDKVDFKKITHIKFGHDFNQNIDSVLSRNINIKFKNKEGDLKISKEILSSLLKKNNNYQIVKKDDKYE